MSDQPTQGFPRELLDQPIAARRHYFETKVVAHQQLKETYEALLHAIRYPAGKSLILLVGPTGVGKTTLLERTMKQLIEDAAGDPTTTPGHMPALMMEAPSPDTGNFSWKDYVTRALIAADEPMLADKITYDTRGIHRDEQGRLIIERAVATPDLRRVLEKCFHHRRPRAFFVDEAQHIKKMASGRRILDQMDTLKSLANMTTTVHVLIGTYELLGVMDLNAQLARRSLTIPFPRYHVDDWKEFTKLLRTFQRHLPFPEEPKLESHAEYFYEQCLGCTGMLKTLLNKAVGTALEQGEQTLTLKHCQQHAEPPQKLRNMLHEIREGEEKLENQKDERHRQELRAMLGLGSSTPGEESPEEKVAPPPTPPSDSPPKRKRGRRVGQRAPKRDRVGKEGNDAE
jgi:energy-coupling factor transporter ATP-binding protein EcfA2